MKESKKTKTIFIGSDHAGYEKKQELILWLSKKYKIVDVGTNSTNSVDYPDYGIKVGENVSTTRNSVGIALCGTGVGMCIAINKVYNIRAALVYSSKLASLAVEHDNANVLCLAARVTEIKEMKKIITIFLNSKFEGGRHKKRIDKIKKYERKIK